ncbi:MAG: hypothetical protein KAJ19_13890 [Gammaproteobacteria bacterium]|nr:hypothetical protein [Gammaproteobacteria bacterium]
MKEIKKAGSKQKKKKETSIIHRSIRELVAVLFWLYTFFKLFVFDIDLYLVDKFFPNYIWLLSFKFFIIIGVIATVWLVTKNKYILIWTLYILFYPFIIFLFKLPYFIFKQKSWVLAFALINAVISFFKSIKYNFITSAIYLIALCIIIKFNNTFLLWFSVIALLVILVATYLHRFIQIFKPSTIFQIYSKMVTMLRQAPNKLFPPLEDELKNLPTKEMDNQQLEKWTQNLQTSILFHRGCYFIAKKLKDYQNSKYNIITYVINWLLLIFITVLTFSAINYGLFKINNDLFNITVEPGFFYFFYYSFNYILFNTIEIITPIAPLSQVSIMIEEFLALVLVVIFVTLLFSVKSDKHSNEINEAIDSIKKQAKKMEGFIEKEYKLPIEQAIKELEKIKGGAIKIIYQLSKYID